jgi:hypothetical protein
MRDIQYFLELTEKAIEKKEENIKEKIRFSEDWGV